jgi:hypothetical protein
MRLLDTEAPVLAACLALLELRGIPAYRSDAAWTGGPRRLPAGCPDITAILPAVRDGGRVYLVVSDVAELARWLDVNLDPSYHRPADFDPPPAA